ncbi:MAG: RNA-binding protein [Candidatus Krumholzibacteria bacterium]|nr:RNA-binding protein [Candidatus Krumholzibacteria bacterium]
MKKIYVGNLPFSATEDDVKELFGQHGTVHSVALINDRETGRPRGFGFIEVDDNDLAGMIQNLDGQEMDGRALRVNEAQDRPRGGGGGGGGGRGGYGGGGGGGGGDRW